MSMKMFSLSRFETRGEVFSFRNASSPEVAPKVLHNGRETMLMLRRFNQRQRRVSRLARQCCRTDFLGTGGEMSLQAIIVPCLRNPDSDVWTCDESQKGDKERC